MPRAEFRIAPELSALLIEARSSVGPIELATTQFSGRADVEVADEELGRYDSPEALLEVPVQSLHSGNALYDAEVHRRLAAARYPLIRAELRSARPIDGDRWSLEGELTIHGATRNLAGSAEVQLTSPDRLRVVGEQVIDIRDFRISVPQAQLFRIYPDVTVRFHIEARRSAPSSGQE